MENYYELLEIDINADENAITEAVDNKYDYWRRRTNSHTAEERSNAEKMMSVIMKAKKVLLNPEEREKYDRELANYSNQANQTNFSQSQSSSNEQNWLEIADYYFKAEEYGSLLHASREAVNQQMQHPMAWYYKAFAEYQNELYSDAEFSYNEAIRLYPNKAPALFWDGYGDLCFSNSQPQKALQCYIQAKKTDPNYYTGDKFVYKRCICLHAMNEYEIAAPLLTEYYNKNGGKPGVANYYAQFVADMIYNAWSTTHTGHKVIASYKQLCFSKQWLSILNSIRISDNSLRELIDILNEEVAVAEKVTTSTGSSVGSGMLEYGLIVGTFHALNQKPNWQWMRDSLSPDELRTGLQ